MSPNITTPKDPYAELTHLCRSLENLLGLRAALASFQVSMQSLTKQIQEPEVRRQLLAMWRPCQQQFDRLLDRPHERPAWSGGLNVLRREVEDNLIDDMYSPVTIADLVATIDQACEAALMQISGSLNVIAMRLEAGHTPESGEDR